MSWARIDDQMTYHRKVVAAGNEAVGAWVRMLALSCAQLEDGRITKDVALTITKLPILEKLVKTGLLDATLEGYQIHDFHDWNPPADEVIAKREADRLRKEQGRKKQVRDSSGRMRAAPNLPGFQSDVRTDSDRSPPVCPPVPSPVPVPIKKEKEDFPNGPSEPAKALGEHQQVIEAYFQAFRRTHGGEKPEILAMDAARAKGMLKKYGLERTVAIIELWFSDPFRALRFPSFRNIDPNKVAGETLPERPVDPSLPESNVPIWDLPGVGTAKRASLADEQAANETPSPPGTESGDFQVAPPIPDFAAMGAAHQTKRAAK